MATCNGFINIYRAGYFHTPGKCGAYDRHPGDIYESEGHALADIHPHSHYVATVPVTWEEPTVPPVNPFPSFETYVRSTARVAVIEVREELRWEDDGGPVR